MKPLLQAAVIVGLFARTAGAAHAKHEGKYAVVGVGLDSCDSWTEARLTSQGTQAFGDGQWVLAFLSGVGFMGGDTGNNPLNGVDADGVWAWIDNYCRDHPRVKIGDAAGAFVHAHPH
jgi:hypothetical protein